MQRIILPIALFLLIALIIGSIFQKSSDASVRKERIMVVIPEVHLKRPKVPDPAGETEVARTLIEAGYKLVDQQQIKKIRDNDVFDKEWKGDKEGALKIALTFARKFGADIMIVGEGFSEFAGVTRVPSLRGMPGGDMISCRARVEAKAVRTDTGQIIATYGAHGSGLDINENIAAKTALANAGREVGEYFVKIFESKSASTSGAGIEMLVDGIKGFSALSALKKQLSSIQGVSNVEVLNFQGGIATIDITFRGNAMEFAGIMEENGVRLKINKFEATRIKATAR